MQFSSMLAAAAVLTILGAALPEPAKALGLDPFVAPEGWDLPLGARRRGDRGDCAQKSSMCDDRFGYRYVRRPWYPGYNSGYWVPAAEMKNRYRYKYSGAKFRYYPAWGIEKGEPPHDYEKIRIK
jgi:hypothetical protein